MDNSIFHTAFFDFRSKDVSHHPALSKWTLCPAGKKSKSESYLQSTLTFVNYGASLRQWDTGDFDVLREQPRPKTEEKSKFTIQAIPTYQEPEPALAPEEKAFVESAKEVGELGDHIFFRNCPVHRTMIYGLTRLSEWAPDEDRGFCAAFSETSSDSSEKFTIGFRDTAEGQTAYEQLQRLSNVLAIKFHHVLWAYASKNMGGTCAVSKKQLCIQMGWAMNHGGIRADHQRDLDLLLSCMKQLEIWIEGSGTESKLWAMFEGSKKSGKWGKKKVYFCPGNWLSGEARKKFTSMGRLPRAFLNLGAQNDQWALILGAYIALHDRIARRTGKPLARKISDMLANAGLESKPQAQIRSGEKFLLALNKLRSVGLIKSLKLNGVSLDAPEEEEDWQDNVSALSNNGQRAQNSNLPSNWQREVLEITTCYFAPKRKESKPRKKTLRGDIKNPQG